MDARHAYAARRSARWLEEPVAWGCRKMKPVALRPTTSLVLVMFAFTISACVLPTRSPPPERPLEERAGVMPARGLVPLDDGRPIPVRFRVSDAVYAFYVVPGPRLAAWAAQEGAKLDVDNGAIVRPGMPPIPLANARDLARRMSGPQNAWLFSAELDLWVPLEGPAEKEIIRDEDVALLEPGLPWHAVHLELDGEGLGIDIDVQMGGAYWRYVMNEPDEYGPVRFRFEAKHRATRSLRLERVREATLAALATLPTDEVLLENLHGLTLEPSPLLSPKRARALFDEVLRIEGVPWDVADDGCGERAMIVSAHLASRGVRSVKVFVVGELALEREPANIEWSFHVAPAVFVDNRGEVEVMIYDPAIARRPMKLVEWLGSFVNGPVVVDVVPWFQRNTIEWGGFEREEDAADNVARARLALDEVIAEWHHEKAARALEDAAAERAQTSGGQRPALSN